MECTCKKGNVIGCPCHPPINHPGPHNHGLHDHKITAHEGPCHAGCGCKKMGKGICTAVVDDVNNRVYLYGDIFHENYHVPGNNCIAWTAVESAGFERAGRLGADEFFDGEQDNNNVSLSHCPFKDNTLLVFLNGVKQREGAEYDYTVNGHIIHFNFYNLLDTDRVEVMYEYEAE